MSISSPFIIITRGDFGRVALPKPFDHYHYQIFGIFKFIIITLQNFRYTQNRYAKIFGTVRYGNGNYQIILKCFLGKK